MSFYLSHIGSTDEQHWQRYTIALEATALAEARACVEREASDLWSFRLLQDSISSLLKPVYGFFFQEMSDVVTLHKFETLWLRP